MFPVRRKGDCIIWLTELKPVFDASLFRCTRSIESYQSFLFLRNYVTGDTFLSMMKNIALLDVPVGTVSQSHDAPAHFIRRVRAFLSREFPDRLIGRDSFPVPLVLQIRLL